MATFILKNGLLPTFFRKLDIFGRIERLVETVLAKKSGFLATSKKMEEIMSKISWESLYENFKSIYPRLSRSSVYFRPFGYMSIVVYFENGMKMVYDDLRKQAYITA